jgi:hypothetical protein
MLIPFELFLLLSTINFTCLLLAYKFRLGIRVSLSRSVLLSTLIYSVLLNLALSFLLSLYGVILSFIICTFFCGPIGDSPWQYIWPFIAGGVAAFSSAIFLIMQPGLISGCTVVTQSFCLPAGVSFIGLVNLLVWLCVAQFKLFGLFVSYHGPA